MQDGSIYLQLPWAAPHGGIGSARIAGSQVSQAGLAGSPAQSGAASQERKQGLGCVSAAARELCNEPHARRSGHAKIKSLQERALRGSTRTAPRTSMSAPTCGPGCKNPTQRASPREPRRPGASAKLGSGASQLDTGSLSSSRRPNASGSPAAPEGLPRTLFGGQSSARTHREAKRRGDT